MRKKQENHRLFLLKLLPKRSVGAEIGVHLGDFSKDILDFVAPKKLHLIDPWEHKKSKLYEKAVYGGGARNGQEEMDQRHSYVCVRFYKQTDTNQVKIHRGRSAAVLEEFPDNYFDWIYIDGCHLYEHVRKDLEISARKVKVDGLITGDDYNGAGWWRAGVTKAVNEFTKNQAAQLVYIMHGQFIFRKTKRTGRIKRMRTRDA
jgi:hypothetical protein